MKTISVVSGCFNEEGNLREFYERVKAALAKFPRYDYEIIVADNRSTDGSGAILRELAAKDRRFKVIFNSRNFGPVTSGYNAFLQAKGDAVVLMSSDLQDPPEKIADLLGKWEEGHQVVLAVRSGSAENPLMALSRRLYYKALSLFADNDWVVENFTGFGLYDRKFMDALKLYRDPDPYFRGFVGEIGFKRTTVDYVQARRRSGRSKHSFFSLYDYAMRGFVNHSKLPLRLASFFGFCIAGTSMLVALGYLLYKLLFWDSFSVGMAPIVIGLFFFSAVQLIFIGIVGEYVGAILAHVKGRPYAIEDEKLNF